MLGKLQKLLILVGLVEGARRFAKANPEAAAQIAVQAAGVLDNLTKGMFHDQIEGVVNKLRGEEA